jgi:hypothetical protein
MFSAQKPQPAWHKVEHEQLEQFLCFKYQRTVAKDNTVTFEATVFQIPKKSPYRSYSNERNDVHVPWTARWSFSTKKEKSLASTPKRRAH